MAGSVRFLLHLAFIKRAIGPMTTSCDSISSVTFFNSTRRLSFQP